MKYGKKCFICKKRTMALYHPPKMITANHSPIITADLAYENHGKCGNTRILTTYGEAVDLELPQYRFSAAAEGNGNAWRMDVIQTGGKNKDCPCSPMGMIARFAAENISELDCEAITRIPIHQPFSIMANITEVELDVFNPALLVVLYMDCEQS